MQIHLEARRELEAQLVDALGGTEDPLLGAGRRQAASNLLARWSEPHRRYHTVTHLMAVLAALELLFEGSQPVRADDRVALRLAAWFHDAVYEGSPGDDEEASAALAGRLLGELGQPTDRVAEVVRLIRTTATHSPEPGDHSAELLVDADLSVLGCSDREYRAYADAVRQEYGHVPEPLFRAGRAQVLRRLTAGERSYRTPRGRLLWEAAARANVSAELARLSR